MARLRAKYERVNQSLKDLVRANFATSEMIAKSPRPFTEGLLIKSAFKGQ